MELPPALHQSRLREGESGEHTQGIEIHRHRGVTAANHDDQRGDAQQYTDPVLMDEPVTHPAHLTGQALVISKHRRQPRKA